MAQSSITSDEALESVARDGLMELVRIEPGRFTMGAGGLCPKHLWTRTTKRGPRWL